LAANYTEFNEILERLPSWEQLNACQNLYSGSEVFYAITERIIEKVSNIQRKLTKFKNIKKTQLEKTLNMLYVNYSQNAKEISEIEIKIRAINDFEIRHKMNEKRIFENLNHERPSKSFLDIPKVIQKNDDNSEFATDTDRENFITNFYADLYRKDEGVGGSIEDFLGPEICAHPLVRDSKLTEAEKLSLEADLTMGELTKALGESNMRLAPGIDGYSNRFINKFWYFLKFPYFKCCKESLRNGTLVDSFSTAQIKIIPKKGDTTKLKNWRPISLLSIFYKILSRAPSKVRGEQSLKQITKGVYKI
jgi:hypothetical protein